MRKALPEPIVILNKEGEEEFIVVPKRDYVPRISIWKTIFALALIIFLSLLGVWIAARLLKKLT